MRGVTWDEKARTDTVLISTHTPHARRDFSCEIRPQIPRISTHTPHARRDSRIHSSIEQTPEFQLTRLMRGVTLLRIPLLKLRTTFQLTRLMRGVTLNFRGFGFTSRFQLTRLMRGVT